MPTTTPRIARVIEPAFSWRYTPPLIDLGLSCMKAMVAARVAYPPLEGEGRVGGLQAAVLDRTPTLCIGYGRTKLSFVRSGRGGVNCSSAPHHASSAAHPIPTCVALRATQHGRCETSAFYSDC